ncbi:MAG: RNA polymerase sigma factor [Rhodothermaceae bacterium]
MSKHKKLSDTELIKLISRFDSRALEEIYERYSALFFTLVKKVVKDDDAAENVLIEIFSILWKKSDRFDAEKDSAFTWLVTLARNKAVDFIKRSRSDELAEYDDTYEDYFIIPCLSNQIDSLDIKTAKNIKPQIKWAFDNLTDAQKYVIELAYFEGRNIEEISGQLNIPVETVRSKITTALQNLKENLLGGE